MMWRGMHTVVKAALCAVCIVAALGLASPACAADAKKPPKLLGSMEFKGKIQKLPKWSRVLAKMKAWKGYFKDAKTASHPSKAGWNALKGKLKGQPEKTILKEVNKFFNKWPYRLDKVNWGVSEYWATPWEFLKKSGDCEDYSIAKFYALQEVGFSGDKMRIVAVKDGIRGIGHAILAVWTKDGDIFILDNQTIMVLSHKRYKHYIPAYSVNEKYRWMHVPPKKKSTYKKKKK